MTPPDRLEAARVREAMVDAGAVPDDLELVSVVARPIGLGHSADSYRVELEWDRPGDGPASLVAKLPSADAASLGTSASLGLYERECRFYSELAPRIRVRTPRFYGVLSDGIRPNGLLLEDLSVSSEPGTQLHDASLPQFRQAREQLVHLQAPFWQDETVGDLPWLHRRLGVPIPAIGERLARSWAVSRTSVCAGLDRREREVVDRFAILASAWAEALSGPFSLVHHDFRFDNLMFSTGGVHVLDWQTAGWGVPMFDLAYLLGTSFSREVRTSVERDEIRRHVDDLAAAGVVGFSYDMAWEAYRHACFAVLLMLVPATASVKRSERGDAMFARLVQFGAQQVLDLDALELPDDVV